MTMPRRVRAPILATGVAVAVLAALMGATSAEAAPAPAAGQNGSPSAAPEATPQEQPSPGPGAEKSPAAAEPKEQTPAAKPGEPPAAESKEQTPSAKKPRKPLTLDQVKQLPPLKRFDIPIEKGEELLKDVRDNTFGYDESAFYYILDRVLKTPPDLFKPDREITPFKALLAIPTSYRGQPVTIRGAYMAVSPFSPPTLALFKDVPVLYECSIREPPLNEARPIATVIVIDNPMEYLHVQDDVKVKGYFYKVRRYEFRRPDENGNIITGEDTAPLLVARRLEPDEPEVAIPALGRASSELLGGNWSCAMAMFGILFVLGASYLYLRARARAKAHAASQRPVHKFRLRRPDRIEPPAASRPGNPGDSPKP
jgi:hypothetical protein